MSFNQQKVIRSVLMWFGLALCIIVFKPYIWEYLFDAPEKEFATKEIVILSIGGVLAIGSKFWDKIIESRIGQIFKNGNKNAS